MREITHIIRQIFMSTRVIENRAKYQFLCFGCALIHFVFAVLMFIGKIDVPLILNIAATLFYVFLGFVLAAKEKYKLLFIVAFIEVEVNATITSILLGEGYDFMIYTLSLIPGAFYLAHTWPAETKNRYGFSLIPIISTLVVGGMYLIVDVSHRMVDPIYEGELVERIKPAFHYLNIMIAVTLLLAFSILFALEVRYIQKLLNDENSRLDEIASRDPLTKAYNRRTLYNIINTEIETNQSAKFGLIILDIDDFKKVNDTYGHIIGDEVLVAVASVLKASRSDGDYFCRWGGEEFLMMVNGTTADFADVAEKIRSSIAKQVFECAQGKFSVTVTLGISEYQTGLQLQTLIDMADQKLYFGKTHGKNQVVN